MSTSSDASPSTPPPPRARRWLRRLVLAGVVLVVVVLVAPLLLGLGPVRSTIADAAGEKLGRRVEIGGASAYWFRGIDVEDITVHSPDGFDGPLATIERIHVDVDLLALLGGALSASVRVVEPHLTLREDAAGRGNQDGVLEHLQEPKSAPQEEAGAPPDLRVAVIGGRIETPATADTPANVVDDLQMNLELTPQGRTLVAVEANLVGAAQGGGNARIEAAADLDEAGSGPLTCKAPALDLSRLSALAERATGLVGLRGSIAGMADATRHGDGTLSGTLEVQAEDLGATTADAAAFSIRRITATSTLRSVSGATEAKGTVQMGDVRVTRTRFGRTEGFREPEIRFTGEGRYSAAEGLLRIASASLEAGGTASGAISAPLRIETKPVLRMQGQGQLRVDLRRLGELHGLIPALEPLAGGVLTARLDGRGSEGIDADVALAIDNLQLRPHAAMPAGYTDRRIEFACTVRRSASEGTRLTMSKLQSAVAQAAFQRERGLSLHIDPEGSMEVDGEFRLRVVLPVLSTLVGGTLGLEAGERIDGMVLFEGSGAGASDQMRVDTSIEAGNVVLPARWDAQRTRLSLRALGRLESSASETTLTLSELRGMGLSGGGTATLAPSREGMALSEASARIGLALDAARGWLAPLLDLDARERLDGQVDATLRVAEADGGRHVQATTQVTNLRWDRGPGTTPVREARIALQANAHLAPEGGRHRIEELRLDTSGLRLDLSGSSYVAEPDADVDATLRLGGDAAKLAPLLSALLGEGYEDLQGRGPLSGELTLRGSPASHGAGLLANGQLAFGSWATGGLTVSNARLAIARPGTADPLRATFDAGMNKGTTKVVGTATLGGEQIPWRGTVTARGVDTSTLLVSQGLGRYLAFALPALLPAGKETPVLSGLLDADLQGGAPSIEDPQLSSGLQGTGRIHMSGGEIKQSTLFGGSNGGGLTKVISVLRVAVPEAGRVLAELTRAVTFSTLDSKFRVANQVLDLEEAKLVGTSAHIDMRGRVDFEKRVALEANVALQGGGGRALGTVLPGGVIPLKVRGTMENPQVTPNVDLAKLAAGGAAGRIPDLLDDLKKKKLPGGIPNPFGK